MFCNSCKTIINNGDIITINKITIWFTNLSISWNISDDSPSMLLWLWYEYLIWVWIVVSDIDIFKKITCDQWKYQVFNWNVGKDSTVFNYILLECNVFSNFQVASGETGTMRNLLLVWLTCRSCNSSWSTSRWVLQTWFCDRQSIWSRVWKWNVQNFNCSSIKCYAKPVPDHWTNQVYISSSSFVHLCKWISEDIRFELFTFLS